MMRRGGGSSLVYFISIFLHASHFSPTETVSLTKLSSNIVKYHKVLCYLQLVAQGPLWKLIQRVLDDVRATIVIVNRSVRVSH